MKKLIFALCSLVLLFGLASCGGNSSVDPTTSANNEKRLITNDKATQTTVRQGKYYLAYFDSSDNTFKLYPESTKPAFEIKEDNYFMLDSNTFIFNNYTYYIYSGKQYVIALPYVSAGSIKYSYFILGN